MPKCCACNSSGSCKFCVCVPSNRRCTNCSPSQHSRCENIALPGTTRTTRTTSLAKPSRVSASTSKPSKRCSLSLRSVSSSRSSSPLASSCPPSLVASNAEKTGVSAAADQNAGVASTSHSSRRTNTPARETPGAKNGGDSKENETSADAEVTNATDERERDLPPSDRQENETSAHAEATNATDERARDLPPFRPAAKPDFQWGSLNGEEFAHAIHCAYMEVVHWRRNVFLVPSGRVGKQFIRELTSLFNAYASGSALETSALEAAMTACAVLLQKPHASSKSRDHVQALERRLRAWQEGDIDGLMRECRTIQLHLPKRRYEDGEPGQDSRIFSRLVFEGKIKSALRFLSDNHKGGVLGLDDIIDDHTVLEILHSKHPEARQMQDEALVTTLEDPPEIHHVLFERLTGASIRTAALRSQGAAGPSGIDAVGWRRMCTSFHRDSADLCEALAAVGRRLCSDLVDPAPLQPLLACRLIPLDKKPGVRPIGICEVLRRILGKAIMTVIKEDVLRATGTSQLCGGHEAGCESAIHAMRAVFDDPDTDGIIFVDASNAFNNLNRKVALHNIQFLCPAAAKILTNCYRSSTNLFVGGTTLLSQEGTTQGDPLAMMMFALAIVPLIQTVKTSETTQSWFADDAACGGRLRRLRSWWDALVQKGQAFGYYPNPSKTLLVVKPARVSEAREVFDGTGIQIRTEGREYLGGYVGQKEPAEEYMQEKIKEWIKEVERLAKFAKSHPHAAFAALIHGLVGKWTYAMRTASGLLDDIFQPLETALSQSLIPSLIGQATQSRSMRTLLGLPPRFGGLGIINPTLTSSTQQEASEKVCKPLVKMILEQDGDPLQAKLQQEGVKRTLKRMNASRMKSEVDEVVTELHPTQRECAIAAQEKGVSSWLTAIPIRRHSFALNKGEFWDAIALRYGWPLRMTPQSCRCGANFSVNHVLTCRQGGWHTIRHNDLRDSLTDLLNEVCTEVTKEPHLQPLSGERLRPSANVEDEARVDIRAHGFWNECQDAFFDVRVFYPCAPSYSATRLSSLYRQHEQQKRREYGQRVRDIEHGGFTPLVFSTSGGVAPEASVFLKRLASLLCEKNGDSYAATIGWLRCLTSFCLLRSSLRCIRASPRPVSSVKKLTTDNITEAVASCHLSF